MDSEHVRENAWECQGPRVNRKPPLFLTPLLKIGIFMDF
jgi:hypothetical protein